MKHLRFFIRFYHYHKPAIAAVIIWRLALTAVAFVAGYFVPLRTGYIGPTVWANFDGIHYLRIASDGYFQYGEAFFPLYPLVIRAFHALLPAVTLWQIGEAVSFGSFLIAVVLWYGLLKRQLKDQAIWVVLLLLSFPTAFYATAVYTEGLFFLLSILTIRCIYYKRFTAAFIFVALASSARLLGVVLIIPVLTALYRERRGRLLIRDLVGAASGVSGLVAYMVFLHQRTGDALRFFHVQSAFGAGRSSGAIIFPLQTLWRYMKIIFTAVGQPTPVSYAVSISELAVTLLAVCILWVGWYNRHEIGELGYAAVSLLVPMLTGTLSSMPRYMLVIFPLFTIAAYRLRPQYKVAAVAVLSMLEAVAVALFVRGWFIA